MEVSTRYGPRDAREGRGWRLAVVGSMPRMVNQPPKVFAGLPATDDGGSTRGRLMGPSFAAPVKEPTTLFHGADRLVPVRERPAQNLGSAAQTVARKQCQLGQDAHGGVISTPARQMTRARAGSHVQPRPHSRTKGSARACRQDQVYAVTRGWPLP